MLLRRHAPHRTALAALLLAGGLSAPAHAAELGSPWATINSACSAGGTVTNQTGQVPVGHQYPVVRLTSTGGPASWVAGAAGPTVGFTNGDVVWSATDPLEAKRSPSSKVSCPDPDGATVPYTVEFFDAPTVPTSFSGRATRLTDKDWGSLFVFLAPEIGGYAADVTIRRGAARFCVYSPGIDFAAGRNPQYCSVVDKTQTLAMPRLEAGPVMVTVVVQPGASVDYTFAVRPLPADVGAASFSTPYMRVPGKVMLSYRASHTASVSIRIEDAAGNRVRALGSGMLVAGGTQLREWDGLDDAGRPVPDGDYRAVVTNDGAPDRRTEAAIMVDSTPPEVSFRSPTGKRSAAVVATGDASSGIARAVVRNGPLMVNRVLATYGGEPRLRVPAPKNGWTNGSKLYVTVADRAGNEATLVGTVRYVPTRACRSVRLRGRVATAIRIKGARCAVARKVARASKRRPATFKRLSFSCRRSSAGRYRCTKGAAVLTFRLQRR